MMSLQTCQMKMGHMLPLGAYLIKPVQRVLKYYLLLEVCTSCSVVCVCVCVCVCGVGVCVCVCACGVGVCMCVCLCVCSVV